MGKTKIWQTHSNVFCPSFNCGETRFWEIENSVKNYKDQGKVVSNSVSQ